MNNNITGKLISEFYGLIDKIISHTPSILLAILILLVSVYAGKKISGIVIRSSRQRSGDPLLARFLGGITRWISIVLGLILALYIIGLGGVAGGLVAGAGISAFIVGFAFKDIAENFLAGIILAFSRPYQIGDTIKCGDYLGNVLSLDIRNTQIKTIDGKDVFIPNSIIIKNPLTNFTKDGFLRMDFLLGIDYNENIADVCKIIMEEVSNVKGVLGSDRKPEIYIEELSASTINIRINFWIDTFDRTVSSFDTRSHVMEKVKNSLIDRGVVMPADIHELKIYREDSPIPVKLIDADKDK